MRVILLFVCLSVVFVSACDFIATIESQTYHTVYVQVTFYNDTKSPIYEFEKDREQKQIRFKGPICNLKPTKLDMYDKYPTPGLKPKGSTSAFVEGIGFVNYVVLSDAVFMGYRIGVWCGAGDCGSSRG